MKGRKTREKLDSYVAQLALLRFPKVEWSMDGNESGSMGLKYFLKIWYIGISLIFDFNAKGIL